MKTQKMILGVFVVLLGLSNLTLATSSEIITTSSYGNWGANPSYYYNDVWNGVPLTGPNYRERVEFNADGIWQVQGLAIGDASNDGTRNVYTAKSYSGYAQINEWDYAPGSGTLSNPHQMFLTLEPSVYKTRGIAVGNADNSPDGRQELIWARQDGGNTYIFADDWNGTALSNQRILWGPNSDYSIYGVAVGDSKNSGQNDVLVAYGSSSVMVVDRFRWIGGTLVGQDRLYQTLEPDTYKIQALTVGDANGDGQNEVLLSMGVPGAYWQVKSLSWNGSSSSWDWADARPTQLWEGDNGMGTYVSGLAITPVPEPTTVLLFLSVLTGFVVRRGRAV
ncbi:MAG: PEP-CTERM sorting domain-containing protein [Phycisphaerae bacterium]